MTREEFILNTTSWSDLLHVCYEIDSEVCSQIYDEYDRDYEIYTNISEGGWNWCDLRDTLNNIPTGYNYYYKSEDTYMEWTGVDEDFEEYKRLVLADGDEREVWEVPEILIPDEDFDKDLMDYLPDEETGLSPLELLTSCNDTFVDIMTDITKKREAQMNEELEFRSPDIRF